MQFILPDGYTKSTADEKPRESLDYWRDVICDEFVQLDCNKASAGNFQGALRGGVGIADLRFSEVITDAQVVQRSRHQISKATEEDFLISFQLTSQGRVQQDGREAILKPGSFAMYDSTRPYTLSFEQRFHQFVVQMPKEVLGRHLLEPEKYTAIPVSGSSGLGSVLSGFIFSLVRELNNLQQAPEELSENLVNMIAMAFSSSVMLEQVACPSIARAAMKRRIKQYIENNLCNPELSNTEIAAAHGVSTRYLHKLFEDEQLTLHSLIMEKRLERALRTLQDPNYTGHSIESIAYSLGFSGPAYFSRSFKKHFGFSPSDARGTG